MATSGNVVDCCSMQLISGDGSFNVAGHEQFINTSEFDQCGLSYRVVSIIGPQSSGKSTLLNQLFGTNFVQMDARQGRQQETEGVWLAKAVEMEPVTIVMDLEGSDSGERVDDIVFERQSALFALAVSDVVLINMWCVEVGREQAANRPLLRTILQVYATKLVHPGKTTLIFVIRDKTETPVERLRDMLNEDIRKIWDNIHPEGHWTTPLDALFDVKVEALSSRQYENEKFKIEVESLKQLLSDIATQDGRSGARVPASAFSFSCKGIWETIQANRDLNIPSHKVLVADKHCEDIGNNVYTSFETNKEWRELENMEQSGSDFPGFMEKWFAIIQIALDSYDSETVYYSEPSRSTRKTALTERLLQLLMNSAQSVLVHIKNGLLEMFRGKFTQAERGGQNLGSAARSCTELVINHFSETLADFGSVLKDLEAKVSEEIQGDINIYVDAYHHGRGDKVQMKSSSLKDASLCALGVAVGALAALPAIALLPEAVIVGSVVYGYAAVVGGAAAAAGATAAVASYKGV